MADMIDWSRLWSLDTEQRNGALAEFAHTLETTLQASTSATSLDDLHPDIAYALKRLVRGLASSRDAARLGFAVGLTELLKRLPDVPISPVIELIMVNTDVSGSVKGEEARDRHFGRLVGVQALLQSGCLDASRARLTDYQLVCNALLGLFDVKSYLKEPAGSLMVDLIRQLPPDAATRDAIANLLLAPTRQQTPETLAWALALGRHTLSDVNIDSAVKILKATHSAKSVEGEPHFIWNVMGSISPSSAHVDRLTRQLLTRDASTTQRREGLLGLQVLMTTPRELSQPAFQLAVQSAVKGKAAAPGLTIAAKKLLSRVSELIKSNPQLALETITRLVGKDGSDYFPALGMTKITEDLASHMPEADRKQWHAMLRAMLATPPVQSLTEADAFDAERACTQLRRWAIEQLAATCSPEAIQTLCVSGFFTVAKPSSKIVIEAARTGSTPPLSRDLQELCRARLYTVLGRDPSAIHGAVDTLMALQSDRKHLAMLTPADEAGALLQKAAVSLAQQLDKEGQSHRVFARLLLCAVIVTFEATTVLPHLAMLKDLGDALLSQLEPDFDANLVGSLLTLLSLPQLLVRLVVEDTFNAFAEQMGEASVDMLIEMVAPGVLIADTDAVEEKALSNGLTASDSSDDSTSDELDVTFDDAEDLTLELGEVNADLRDHVESALREANMLNGDDEDTVEDEGLDDEAMFALDEQLARAFRSESKQVSKKAVRLQDTNAKLKVLDLLHLYLKAAPSSPLMPKIVVALSAASSDAELSAKATRLLASAMGIRIRAEEATTELMNNAGVYLDRLLLQTDKVSPQAATYLLRLLPSDASAAQTLRPAIEAFTARKTAPFTEHTLLSLVKARPGAFVPLVGTFADAIKLQDIRPMRKRQLTRTFALILQLIAAVGPSTVWRHMADALAGLAVTVDPAGPADTAREQLKVLAATLRLVRHPKKLPTDNIDVNAICTHARLDARVTEVGAFGGSKPCVSLAKEVQNLAQPIVHVNGHANGINGSHKQRKRKLEDASGDKVNGKRSKARAQV